MENERIFKITRDHVSSRIGDAWATMRAFVLDIINPRFFRGYCVACDGDRKTPWHRSEDQVRDWCRENGWEFQERPGKSPQIICASCRERERGAG